MSELGFMEKLLEGASVEWKQLGDISTIKTGPNINKKIIAERPGSYPVINSGRDPLGFVDHFNVEDDPIGIASRGSVGLVTWTSGRFFRGNLNYSCSPKDKTQVNTRYLYHYLLHADAGIQALATHQGIPALNSGALKTLQVPIPVLDVQAEIVRILDSFTELTAELTAELEARTQQYNHYRDQLLSFEGGDVEWKPLGKLCTSILAGGDVPEKCVKGQTEPSEELPYPVFANAVGEKGLYGFSDSYRVESDAVTISARGAKIGYHTIRDGKFTPIIRLIVLVADKSLISTDFLNYVLEMTPISGTKGGIPQLTVPTVKKITVPVPFPNDPRKSLAEQARIVTILDKFDTLTNSLSEGLPREIKLRQQQYEYYRDLLLSFPKPEEGT